MALEPLPARLAAAAFTVADARAARVRAGRLRGRDLARTTQSVRAPVPLLTLRDRASAFGLALPPDAAFSHVTAARLWRLPLPPWLERQDLLDVIRPSDRGRVVRRGCAGHKGLESREVDVLDGVRVVGLTDVWCDLGSLVGHGLGVDDLVVIGDAVVRRLDGGDTILVTVATSPSRLAEPTDPARPAGTAQRSAGVEALVRALGSRTRPRGKRALTEALTLVRPGSRSPMETRARLMFLRAGLPEPRLSHVVRSGDGEWLLEGDLVWEEQRVIGEYQGDMHASISRRSSDAHRRGLAEDQGWRVIEIFAEDVFRPPRRLTCLRRFADALGLDSAGLDIL